MHLIRFTQDGVALLVDEIETLFKMSLIIRLIKVESSIKTVRILLFSIHDFRLFQSLELIVHW